MAKRVTFRSVYIRRKARDGIAYIEFHGECAWDREHGFSAVLHRQRVIAVVQQGSGWKDGRVAK